MAKYIDQFKNEKVLEFLLREENFDSIEEISDALKNKYIKKLITISHLNWEPFNFKKQEKIFKNDDCRNKILGLEKQVKDFFGIKSVKSPKYIFNDTLNNPSYYDFAGITLIYNAIHHYDKLVENIFEKNLSQGISFALSASIATLGLIFVFKLKSILKNYSTFNKNSSALARYIPSVEKITFKEDIEAPSYIVAHEYAHHLTHKKLLNHHSSFSNDFSYLEEGISTVIEEKIVFEGSEHLKPKFHYIDEIINWIDVKNSDIEVSNSIENSEMFKYYAGYTFLKLLEHKHGEEVYRGIFNKEFYLADETNKK